MTATPTSPAASQQAAVDAALLILERMGLSPDDLTAAPRQRPAVPSFADYVPVVSATLTDGTRRAYGTYWNRITEQWGTRRLDEPTPSEVRQLMKLVKANAVQRRNGRGGGRPPRYRPWSRVWTAITVRTRMLVRTISRLDDSPSTVMTRSSCSELKSTRPLASGSHSCTP